MNFPPLLQQILMGGGIKSSNPLPGATPPFFPVGSAPGAPAPASPAPQPSAPQNAPQGFFGKADAFLQNPFIANLLAQEGTSLTPTGGPLAAIGRASLLTAQQKQQQGMEDLQRRLIEARIGSLSSPGEQFRTLSPEEKKELGIPEQSFAQQSTTTGAIKINDPPGPLVKVDARSSGPIPAGFEVVHDDQGNPIRMRPIPGSPAAIEAERAAEAAGKRQDTASQQADIVSQEIDRALGAMGVGANEGILPDTGFGALLKDIPGTDAQRIANSLKTIKANIGFDQLQKMREASPTGGALGQVSEREIDFLQSVAGSLDQSQGRDDLTYNLNRLWNAQQDVIHGPGNGPPRRPLVPPHKVAGGAPEGVDPALWEAMTPEERALWQN